MPVIEPNGEAAFCRGITFTFKTEARFLTTLLRVATAGVRVLAAIHENASVVLQKLA